MKMVQRTPSSLRRMLQAPVLGLLFILCLMSSCETAAAQQSSPSDSNSDESDNINVSMHPAFIAPPKRHQDVQLCLPHKSPNHRDDPILHPLIPSGLNPFCVNGGTCKEDYENTPEFPCICPDDMEGPHCEFVKGTMPTNCDLDCFNGGTCQNGIKWYGQVDFASQKDLEYCLCPDGYFGTRCEAEARECGPYHCFHGGSCVEVFQPDESVENRCDCTMAQTTVIGETGKDTVVHYSGRFCQSPATSYCSKFANHNGRSFCVNGGECRNDGHLGCSCKAGFVGPICEFEEEHEIEHHKKCSLKCANNGVCRKGKKDLSILNRFGVERLDAEVEQEDKQNDLSDSYNEDFEHCVCPPGYVGLTCEHRMDVCPGRQHVCMNGAHCKVKNNNLDENGVVQYGLAFECDCDKVQDPFVKYTGKYCEYASDMFCTDDGSKPPASGVGSDAFCANQGTCINFVQRGEPHPGCRCTKEFEGPNCQFAIPTVSIPDRSMDFPGSNGNDTTRGAMAISMAVGITLFILLGIFTVIYVRQKRRARNFIIDYEGSSQNSPPTLNGIHSAAPFRVSDESGMPQESYHDDGTPDKYLDAIMEASQEDITTSSRMLRLKRSDTSSESEESFHQNERANGSDMQSMSSVGPSSSDSSASVFVDEDHVNENENGVLHGV